MDKRGSHVGMMLSFVVFVTFLVFIYSITQPALKKEGDKETILNFLKTELVKRVSANLTSYSINIEGASGLQGEKNCFIIANILEFKDENVIVKDEGGSLIGVTSSADKSELKIDWNDQSKKFFKIYYSKENLLKKPASNDVCKNIVGEYTKRGIKTDLYVFEEKMKNILDEDYAKLKNDFGVPENTEFSIEFKSQKGGFQDELPSTNVYAEEIPIQYVDEQANINTDKIIVRVW
ncbi:MAG: hypothetical protein KKA64_00215 [Nanoarchaeota archaeon]|nr:hypothetical protein [Nanoarchaeota archaeon]